MAKIFINDKLFDEREAKVSVFDEALLYGYGAYETLRAYGGVVFKLEEHLQRLEHSLEALEIKTPYSKARVQNAVYQTIRANGLKDAAARVVVTAGASGLWGSAKPSLIVIARPAPERQASLKAVTVPFHRDVALAKSLNCLTSVLAKKIASRANANEALFTLNGCVLEGTTSNVFVLKDGELLTPKEDILHGVTRNIVLGLAEKLGLKPRECAVRIKDVYLAEEAFLTGTVKEIVSLEKVDDVVFKKSDVAERVRKAYADEVRRETRGKLPERLK